MYRNGYEFPSNTDTMNQNVCFFFKYLLELFSYQSLAKSNHSYCDI